MRTISIGEAASILFVPKAARARKRAARRGTPVLRNSLEAGTFEHAFFKRVSHEERRKLSGAFEAAAEQGMKLRQAAADGQRLSERERLLASLNNNALVIYNKLLNFAAGKSGAIFPSYEQLAEWTRVSRATVARVIALLCRLQLLFRQRRFTMTDNDKGARYRQTSNAYRVFLPPWIERLLPRRLRCAPLPDDEIQRQQDRLIDQAEMLKRLSLTEYVKATIADDSLAAALAKLGAGIEARESCESHHETEPGDSFIFYGDMDAA